MVLEGHDGTNRPILKTYEFDKGRVFLDQWDADGKPMWSRKILNRYNAVGVVVGFCLIPAIFMSDFGEKETVVSPFQRSFFRWYTTFMAMDVGDVAKARSVAKWKWATEDDPLNDPFWTFGYRERTRPFNDADAGRAAFGEYGVTKGQAPFAKEE